MTDNQTNEPNKYSGFLARQNHQRDPWRGIGAKCLCGKVFDLDADHALHQVDEILRAALVAAQEAAPQAESEPKPHTRVVTRSLDSDCALGICMSGCSHLMWVCDSCSSEGGWGATRDKLKKWAAEHVCPVQPSSGVDEDKLAEVIEQTRDRSRKDRDIAKESLGQYIARIVNERRAEWLKGQGR